jgi:calcineurin-like phosphoesterase family protein
MIDITFISDTHTYHRQIPQDWLPGGAILCHTGDFCLRGNHQEALDFFSWFSELPYEHKVFIAGNHDICFDHNHSRYEGFLKQYNSLNETQMGDIREHIPDNIVYLENSSVIIEGIKFYGSTLKIEENAPI